MRATALQRERSFGRLLQMGGVQTTNFGRESRKRGAIISHELPGFSLFLMEQTIQVRA